MDGNTGVGQRANSGEPFFRPWRARFQRAGDLGCERCDGNHHRHEVVLRHRGENVEDRSEEHTSELQSLMRISYAVFCLKKKKTDSSYQQESTIKDTTMTKSHGSQSIQRIDSNQT